MKRILILILATAAAWNASAVQRAFGARPNIVFILTDDQGYGELSCHGNPILRTPHLDQLHAESIRFTDFQVSPTCSPTRAALMTGRHEFRSGVTHTIFERERLSLGAVTLADVLRGSGYATGIFGKWHLGDEPDHQPDRRGFDEVFIHGGGGIGQTYPGSCGDVPGNSYFHPVVRHNGRFEKTQGYCTDVFFDAAAKWIDARRQAPQPFFAFITPNAPHDPLTSPGPEWEAPYLDKGLDPGPLAYYAMIANIDANVGRLMDRLKAWNLETNTLVVFMTDNGHSISSLYNAGMRGLKGTPYQGGTRVPSFWRWKGMWPGGADCDRLTAHIDMFPTLLELAGIPPSRPVGGRPLPPLEGRSLVPLLRNPSAEWADRMLFIHFGRWESGHSAEARHRQCAVRTARYRLVNDLELYDLQADPGETRNVIEQHTELVASLRLAYEQWWDDVMPAALQSEYVVGPLSNPFKRDYWAEHEDPRDASLLLRMDPAWKFDPQRPKL